MSNLRNTTRLPLRASMANKWKSHTLTNDLLVRKTRTLEGSLNKLKFTTQRDKVKVTMNTSGRVKPTEIRCGQCEKDEAKMKCVECVEVYCASCYSHFHLRGALQRHHCILLSSTAKENEVLTTDIVNSGESNTHDSRNEKTNIASFQQSFLQWREENSNKSKRIQQRRGLTSPIPHRIDHSSKLPYLDSNGSKTTLNENVLSKKSRPPDRNNQRSTRKDPPKINVPVQIHHSSSNQTSIISTNDLSVARATKSIEVMPVEESSSHDHHLAQNEDQEQAMMHTSIKAPSRPMSSSIKKDLTSSRSNSTTLPEQSQRSVLAAKSTDELEAIIDPKSIFSRPSSSSSSISEKLDLPLSWRPLQSTSKNINAQSVVIDQNTIAQFDSALEDLFDESKIELAYRLNSGKDRPSAHISGINFNTTTPRRHSPFSFSNPFYKMSRINSSSSRDADDEGFFTDVVPRQIHPLTPPPILECSTSNEWKHAMENQATVPESISLPKLSIPSLSRPASKHSITYEEIDHQSKSQLENSSRPGSSLSSSSLPISISSSKAVFHKSKVSSSTTSSSSRKGSSSTTTKDSSSSSSTTKTSPVPNSTSNDVTPSQTTTSEGTTTTMETSSTSSSTSTETTIITETSKTKPTIENSSSSLKAIITGKEKVTSPSDADACLEESMKNSSKDKISSNEQFSNDTNNSLKQTSTIHLTRGVNITENDLSTQKKTHRHAPRQSTTTDESSQFRKLEFSVGDGVKWQEASIESMSSTKTIVSKQSSSPINTKLAEEFSKYDNDDGRSSRTYQNLNDDEYFNELRQEFCSELDKRGSDEDALLNNQLLKILSLRKMSQ